MPGVSHAWPYIKNGWNLLEPSGPSSRTVVFLEHSHLSLKFLHVHRLRKVHWAKVGQEGRLKFGRRFFILNFFNLKFVLNFIKCTKVTKSCTDISLLGGLG